MKNEVTIIGADPSGLGCAKTLQKAGVDFKIITKNIGGRILHSENKQVNYGAYYMTSDYKNMNEYFVPKRRIYPMINSRLHYDNKSYMVLGLEFLLYLRQYLRLRKLLKKFRKHLQSFRKNAEFTEQQELIQKDEYLNELYHESATSFFKRYKLETLLEKYIDPLINASGFVDVRLMQAFDVLWLGQPMVLPIHSLQLNEKKINIQFSDCIQNGDVKSIEYKDNLWNINLDDNKVVQSDYLVLAVPTPEMQRLTGIKDGRTPATAYMYHLSGKLKKKWKRRAYNLFPFGREFIILSAESDGTYLLYSKEPTSNFHIFFDYYQIIAQRNWSPAFNILGVSFVKQSQGNKLFIAGEHNICSIEDSFITGIYAANQIISSRKSC